MIEKIIEFFATRHLLTNAIFVVVILGGIITWRHTGKEELPAVTFNSVHIRVTYPGATAEDVEYFVTRPIEEKVRGLDGVNKVTSSSTIGKSQVEVELENSLDDINQVVTEIRNEVLDVDMPDEVVDDPEVRVFQTDKKAILDIAVYNRNKPILNVKERRELQAFALALENRLLSLTEVNSINRRHYLAEEIQVKVYPDRLKRYKLPFSDIMQEIRENHVRKPAGTLDTEKEPRVTLLSELNTPERLRNLIIHGGFEGQVIRLGDVADIDYGVEKTDSVVKVNGRECVMLNVVKNPSAGILVALESVTRAVDRFRQNNMRDTPYELVLLDDESIDVRNRLHIIAVNGAIGFALILAILLIFLNWRSGLWVAMGIPFTFCFTMMAASFMGQTINGVTLAAVIIVMGIVVDDAIVVAENITRLMQKGMERLKAIVEGTSYVMLPVIASIVTTCAAFIPLYFFQGRHGMLIVFIPPIIFLMLGASLLEAVIVLPGHMNLSIKLPGKRGTKQTVKTPKGHWFDRVELAYGKILQGLLHLKWLVLPCFIGLLVLAVFIITQQMKYEMFPNEETRDIVLTGKANPEFTRYQTAEKVQEVEDLLIPYIGQEVVGFRTGIARSRRGNAAEQNQFRITIEIVPREQRKMTANQFINTIKEKMTKLDGFYELQFQKSRWGQDSGSPVEIVVQENRDDVRHIVTTNLAAMMSRVQGLKNVEVDEGRRVTEYRVRIDDEKIKRLNITPSDVATTFRAALEGSVLYDFTDGDQEIRVRFTTIDDVKGHINDILSLPVENRNNYLVPLKNVVTIEECESPTAIIREDLKRTSEVFADIETSSKKTPLEIANELEDDIFPAILAQYPTARIAFGGEIKDTREATSDFENAIWMVLALIYLILAILFESLWKPLIIMLAIPFGMVGIIFAFYLHGKTVYGFYAVIGALGLAGVVVNDAIIMLVKLNDEYDPSGSCKDMDARIAAVARTRLRAVVLTTLTTVAGILPTAYGWAGYDAMLAEMMLALTWGMVFGTLITLILIPAVFSVEQHIRAMWKVSSS